MYGLDFAGSVGVHQPVVDLIAALVREGVEGSVNTLPGSFEFITDKGKV